jgi:3-hydroxybutyryl-CoA dehydrogenase
VIGDLPGLLVARTVAMLVNKAADVAGRGVATGPDVDKAMRLGTNYPIGPLTWGSAVGFGWVVTLLDILALSTATAATGPARRSGGHRSPESLAEVSRI